MKRWLPWLLPFCLASSGCFSGFSNDDAAGAGDRVHRGRFVSTLTLTGELEAARGDVISVPRLPSWQSSIKWLSPDGEAVKKGDRVVELDNSEFASNLDAKRQAVAQAEQSLQQSDAQARADLLNAELDVDKKQADFDKTKLDADVPSDIVSARDFQDRQIKFKRAKVELAKSRSVLQSQRTAARADRANLLLELGNARRDLQTAEDAISALILRAPRDGIVVLRDHPWEGRKIKEGDAVFVGMPLAMLPDPSSLQVAAMLQDVDDGKITAGMPATVVLDAYPDLSFPGRVAEISSVAQESRDRTSLRRWFRVAVRLERLDRDRMRPGLSARVTVRRLALEDALLVPRAAVDFSGAKPAVGSKPVTLGACNDSDCVVLAGLKEGERAGGGA